ncbi:MAG: peptidoglycan DD-metalloendopeptidase family protein [Rickettsiales bacterium]
MPAHAEPTLEQKKKELDSLQVRIEESKQKIDSIKQNSTQAKKDMEVLENSISDITRDLKKSELQYRKIDAELKELEKTRQAQVVELRAKRRDVAGMLSASIRLSQTPELAVLVIPDDAAERVTAARALGLTAVSLKDDMQELADELSTFEAVERSITKRREKLDETRSALSGKKERLEAAIGERQGMLKNLSRENEREQQRIAAFQRQSKDLSSLVTSLEKERDAALRMVPKQKPSPPGRLTGSQSLPSITSAKGGLKLPATGSIVGQYGDRRGVNNTLKGMEIATIPGAVVTAPFDGEVLFTGKFLDYGNIVILRHSQKYHTLLAGLDRIQAIRGQVIPRGAPLGMMGQQKGSRLYVEFRQSGKPIDPVAWYQGMSRLAKRE